MATPMKGEARIALSTGETLVLVFDFDAFMAAEEACGLGINEILGQLEAGTASLRVQRALFFGALQRHHADIALDEVGPLLLREAKAMQRALDGLAGGMPRTKEAAPDGGEGPPGPRRGTGTGR